MKKTALAIALTAVAILTVASVANADDPNIAAVGDIACPAASPVTPTTCRQAAVAKAIAKSKPDSFWILGDVQYPYGSLADFKSSFDPTFKRFKTIWRPTPGNHEYYDPGAAGYYDYFGKAAGPNRRGYYSFNLGKWHIVSLNTNCDVIDCSPTSPQAKWLSKDLNRNPRLCTAAFYHHPLYKSGTEPGVNDDFAKPFWKILQGHRAEVALAGHVHNFEAFMRQDVNGKRDKTRGIAEFVVGTGGRSAYPFSAIQPNSFVRKTDVFGFLSMDLHAKSYSWRFLDEKSKSLASGSSRCR